MIQFQALPLLPDGAAKAELKTCKLGRYHAAKLHLAIGNRTLCGRDSFTHLRKTKFDFSRKCCKFCCNLAIPQKLGEVRGAGAPRDHWKQEADLSLVAQDVATWRLSASRSGLGLKMLRGLPPSMQRSRRTTTSINLYKSLNKNSYTYRSVRNDSHPLACQTHTSLSRG